MEYKKCAICSAIIENEEPAILSIAGSGYVRYLCDGCAADMDEATLGRDFSSIEAAMDRIGKHLGDSKPDNGTFKIVSGIMKRAADRAKAIRDGSYDFALDEEDSGNMEDIPEELLETEEDKLLDEQDAEKQKKFDKIFERIAIGIFSVVVLFLLWRLLDTYFF